MVKIEDEYFDWLCGVVCGQDQYRLKTYYDLLLRLHSREFVWSIYNDENRAEEGVALRSRFAAGTGYGVNEIYVYMSGPCTILEMMVALAISCEEDIMSDPGKGDRTSQWFWGMIRSLGLMPMCGRYFDSVRVDTVLDRFLDRRYLPNGEGGLFTIRSSTSDLRDVEIWHQLCWYLDDVEGL